MRVAIVLLYAALSLNLAAGVAGAVALPDGHPVIRALGAAMSRPRHEEPTLERVADDIARY